MSKTGKMLLICGMLGTSSITTLVAQEARPPAVKPVDLGKQRDPVHLSSPMRQTLVPRYEIKRQDVLELVFPLSPELNQTLTVQPDGFINLRAVSGIRVEGLTVPQVEQALQTSYSKILNQPIINVDLKDFQKPFFTVSGQVGKPGQYELRSDINVAEAIAQAGGLAATAKYQVYIFHRTSADYYEVEKIDMKKLLTGKNLNDNAMIRPGDMILVPESGITTFRKYVPYSLGASYFPN